jgi:wyosine [tRNA(Phe)-imidazoG37] synthetase (radical SAM superfamily)
MSEAFDFKNEYFNYPKTDVASMSLCYGPIALFGFASSIGVNLLGQGNKICSFDCLYCDLGRTKMRLNRVKKDGPYANFETLEFELDKQFALFSEKKMIIDAIHISGNGEPTLYPYLTEAIDIILKLRDKYFSQAKTFLLTNGAHLDQRKVLDAANKLDAVIFKLDVGNDQLLKAVNSPLVRSTLSHLISISQSVKNLTLQSLFVQGEIDNTKPSDIEDWIEVIGLMKPRRVFICTVSQAPATNGLLACDEDTLYTIASKLERKTGLRAEVIQSKS